MEYLKEYISIVMASIALILMAISAYLMIKSDLGDNPKTYKKALNLTFIAFGLFLIDCIIIY